MTITTSKSTSFEPTLSADSRKQIHGTRWAAMDEEIDENLGAMGNQLARLRALGTALGDEVEDQNQMLTRIDKKTDRNDAIVRSQDNQMKKVSLLKTLSINYVIRFQLLGYKSAPAEKK